MKILLIIVLLISVMVVAANASSYVIHDLGVLPGFTSSYARGINSKGQVVGYCQREDGIRHAFLWDSDKMTDLGTLDSGRRMSWALAINDSGQIVGYASVDGIRSPSPSIHPVTWNNGIISDMIISLNQYGAAADINNSGVIVGQCGDSGSDFSQAVIWQSGDIDNLDGNAGINTMARAITDNGYVVGSVSRYATMWYNGIRTTLSTNGTSFAWDVNDIGQAVGYYYTTNAFRNNALLWQNGNTIDLLGLGGNNTQAYAINNNGQIVGNSSVADGSGRAVLWKNGVIQVLDGLGGNNAAARGINNYGMIVGYADLANGNTHATLWEPVPEPSGFLVILSGLVSAAGCLRLRMNA